MRSTPLLGAARGASAGMNRAPCIILHLLGSARPARQHGLAARCRAEAYYDVVIVGGGGHGLATAYYLAKEHGITNVAVLEKGWIGSRQCRPQHHHRPLQLPAARQHPVLRMVDEAVGGPGAGPQLQRHGQPARRAQPLPFRTRSATPSRGAAMPCGCTASMPSCSTATGCARCVPFLDFDNARFPIQGGLLQRRGGTARHDAVAWGYARGADMRGVDIIQNCEVTGFRIEGGRVTGVETTRGTIAAGRSASRSPATLARGGDGGPAAADREPRAAGLRVEASSR